MKVSALDKQGDWRFGAGKANYIGRIDAINQKVITRVKSFKNDNPLNMDANIDWIDLLSRRNTENTILKELERVVLGTEGVLSVIDVTISSLVNRVANIQIQYVTIYGKSTAEIAEI